MSSQHLVGGVGSVPSYWCYKLLHQVSLIAQQMASSVVSIHIGKVNNFHRPDESMLFVMLKACLDGKFIQLFRAFKKSVLHIQYSLLNCILLPLCLPFPFTPELAHDSFCLIHSNSRRLPIYCAEI